MLRSTKLFLASAGRRAAASSVVAAVSAVTPATPAPQAPAAVPVITPQMATAAFHQLSNQMIRSFRLDQVLSQTSPNDIVVARQDASTSRYSFIGFKNISALDVSRSLLMVPEHMRHFHTVCARENSPCDFYADIDLPLEADGEDTLLQVTDRLYAMLDKLSFGRHDTILLESKHKHKQSFHLHVRGQKSAFTDFRAVRAIADQINQQLGSPAIDVSCYRYNGTLRTAFCAKLVPPMTATSGSLGTSCVSHLVPFQAKDSELMRRISGMTEMSAEQLFEASLVNRQIPTEDFPLVQPLQLYNGVGKRSKLAKLLSAEGGINTCEAAGDGKDAAHRFLREDVKWLRYKNAVKKVRQLPMSAADDYSVWISVGLALHSFGSENHIFDEWMRFSSKCPEKFSRDQCQNKWLTFNAGNDTHNWRRGYNYLTSTVWRQFGCEIPTDSHRPRL